MNSRTEHVDLFASKGDMGIQDIAIPGHLQVIRDLIPEGQVEMWPSFSLPVQKMPNRWHRFWMRLLLGWRFSCRS